MSNSNLAEALRESGLNPDQIADIEAAGAKDVAEAKPKRTAGPFRLKVSEKGCVSVYGGTLRFRGVHLYAAEWMEILSRVPELCMFVVDNAETLKFTDAKARDAILEQIEELSL